MKGTPLIRPVTMDDAEAIRSIYNYYIERTPISFEEMPVTRREMAERIRSVTASFPWYACEEAGEILAYAYMHPFRERSAYRFTLEDSIYVRHDAFRRGFGRTLLARLLADLAGKDIHSVIAAITIPNEPSVVLHQAFGFKKIGHLREVGYKFDRWIDVGYWEYLTGKDRKLGNAETLP
ncbi:MAG: GNAT family N-acetyltransferase [Spirochaetaceae bacterium]|nr:GNAT family N-acetyltransferase [Spirochaetaceae bacterium]